MGTGRDAYAAARKKTPTHVLSWPGAKQSGGDARTEEGETHLHIHTWFGGEGGGTPPHLVQRLRASMCLSPCVCVCVLGLYVRWCASVFSPGCLRRRW